jgi:hypothetical protein
VLPPLFFNSEFSAQLCRYMLNMKRLAFCDTSLIVSSRAEDDREGDKCGLETAVC